MTAKVKSALARVSDTVETAAGYALIAVAIYAALFVDITGNGPLWKNLNHLLAYSEEGVTQPQATRVATITVQHTEQKPHEDRILAVFDEPSRRGPVSVVYQAPDAVVGRPTADLEETLVDTPADPAAGSSWKRGLSGKLRSFTVYGDGDQTSSASQPAGAAVAQASRAQSSSRSPAPQAPSAAASSRPGLGSRSSAGSLSAPNATRNAR